MRGVGAIVMTATVLACGALEGSPAPSTTTEATTDSGAPTPEAGSPDAGHLPAQPCNQPLLSDTFDRASTDVQGPWSLAVQSTTTKSTVTIDPSDGAAATPSLAVDLESAADPGTFTGRGAYLRKTFASPPSTLTLRFAMRYGSFTTGADHLTIAELDTGTDLQVLLAVKPDGTIYAAEQLLGGPYNALTAPVSLPVGTWTVVTLTFDANNKAATLDVGGVRPPANALALSHGGVSRLQLGAVYAAYSGRGRYSFDDVCVF